MKRRFSIFIILLILPTLVWGQGESLDASFSNPTDMTDQQMSDAKDFVHTGIKDRVVKDGCAQKDLKNCQADDGGLPIETIIGKAYALIFGGMMSGGKPTLTKKATNTTPPPDTNTTGASTPATETKAEAKEKTDYCMYAAMAYETLGGLLQQSLQSKGDKSAQAAGDVQLQALVSLKETHKARKTTATWQGALYGGIAACYGAMAFTGAQLDWKYWAKLGGATALSGLYLKKANKHANAAKKVQTIIDSLPKSGDCNPWTGTSCFCKELTSKAVYPMEYEQVCVLNDGNFETPKVALGCGTVVNGSMQFDKDCKCKETNSCYKASIKSFTPNFDMGANFMNSANTGFDLLSDGNFDEGKLNSYATGAAAMASGLKPKGPVKTPKINLTPDQKKLADQLQPTLGSNAALAAVSPGGAPAGGISDSSALQSSALSKLSDELKEKLADGISGNYKKGGSGFNSNAQSDEPSFVFPGMQAAASATNNGTEILTFAEQAINKADVSNAPETPIFDIISNRYRRSGWEKLQTIEK